MMIVGKAYCLVTFFPEEEDCDQVEDKYSLEHDECAEESPMSNKVLDEDSWTFMEDPIYDMSKEEYNESKSFEGFIDNLLYVMPEKGSIESLDGFIEDLIYEFLERVWILRPWEAFI